jgi:exosortase/archaeosortase family protein
MAAVALLAIWIASNFSRITGDQDGTVRFVLGGLFALLILFRSKESKGREPSGTRLSVVAGFVGACLAVSGIVFNVRQSEWLGIIAVLYACLRWGLPRSYSRDIFLSLLLLYWIHPLPTQLFGQLQLAMQGWSVAGAEWLLHALNVRVWADTHVLYTSYLSIAVPESCSGMRASITVLLLAWGMGMLLRYHWWEIILLTLLGIGQVLALNIVRIAAVVKIAPSMDPAWAETFLHDTLGTFLLVAIVLVSIEASIWQVIRTRRRELEEGIRANLYERPNTAKPMPRFWILFFRWAKVLVLVVIVIVIAAAAVYKSRPSHRLTMRREVIGGLMDTQPEVAERAIAAALIAAPKDRTLLSHQATVLVMRRKFEEALEVFALLPPPLSPFETVLKSWAEMGTGRREQAIALIDALPESTRRLPGVAIVRAEYAVLENDHITAAKYIVHAGNSSIPSARLRSLYEFLAANSQWEAIVKSDSDEDYLTAYQAYCAVQACLHMNDLAAASKAMKRAVKKWPREKRFLGSLFTLAVRHPGTEWETHFANNLRANFARLDPGELSRYLEYSFQLSRSDLAWLTYLVLSTIDAKHPDVFFAPGRYGGQWFVMQGETLKARGAAEGGGIDLRPLMAQTRRLWPLQGLWSRIPQGEKFSVRDTNAVQQYFFARCLAELEKRRELGTLRKRGRILLPAALATQERFFEAHEALDELAENYPELKPDVMLLHAEFYDRKQEWGNAYESLRIYMDLSEGGAMKAQYLMINALLNMNLGVYGLEIAEKTRRIYPHEPSAQLLLAAVWELFGFKEQALYLLGDQRGNTALQARARLSAETGRANAAKDLYGAMGVGPRDIPTMETQYMKLVAAEASVRRRWVSPLSDEEMASESERFAALATGSQSPFISALDRATSEWYRERGADGASNPGTWMALGRDDMEKVSALHRLAVLEARQLDYDAATDAALRAAEIFPTSPVLQRMLVALREGELETVKVAREHCPDDSEIWLASLVVRNLEEGPGDWADEAVRQAMREQRFSVETWVRAGDFLLRSGMLEPADLLAKRAVREANGLIAAYALGLRCALESRDAKTALECARLGVEHSEDPGIFWKAIVEVKSIENRPDRDMIDALRNLAELFPDQPEWGQYLGQVHFSRGESRDALKVLEAVISRRVHGVTPDSYVIAAESARLAGQHNKAIRILRNAHSLHPDDLKLLNNLVYMLSQKPDSAVQALTLLPRLLELGEESFAVLDTAAMVCLRNGQTEKAKAYMARALDKLDSDAYSAVEIRLNAAELLIARAQYREASETINKVRKSDRVTKQLDERARRMLDRIRRIEAEQERL